MAKIRSPNYPGISLPDAIERICKIHSKAHTHKVDSGTMAKAAGYNSLNGSALTVLSALKKYGLLDEVGNELRVSPAALTIIADPVDSPERRQAIQAAAFGPPLFMETRKQFPDSIPGDEIIRSFLLKRSFLASSIDTAIRAFRETMNLVTEEGLGYTAVSNQLDAKAMPDKVDADMVISASSGTTAAATKTPGANTVFGQGIEVASYPVAKDCIVRLRATGPLTATGMKNLVKQLQLGIDIGLYPDDTKTE